MQVHIQVHVLGCQRLSALAVTEYYIIVKVMKFFESKEINRNDEHVVK